MFIYVNKKLIFIFSLIIFYAMTWCQSKEIGVTDSDDDGKVMEN